MALEISLATTLSVDWIDSGHTLVYLWQVFFCVCALKIGVKGKNRFLKNKSQR